MQKLLTVSLLATLAACHPTGGLPKIPDPEASIASAPPVAVADPGPPRAVVAPARSPEGLARLLAEYDARVDEGADEATLAGARDAIDRMAGQRDAFASGLFWYTDLEAAKAAAQKSGRPILALRLLGRLDEELSCANSRLFRLVLYPNQGVSQLLRDEYVLYWSSERPVPRMTVDFGDGRVLERTLTGNSVHYVLDARGRIVDALPGLYGPAAFQRALRRSLDLARRSGDLGDAESAKEVARYHQRTLWAETAAWRKQLDRVYGESYGEFVKTATLPVPAKGAWPHALYDSLPARAVNELTMSKADMEAPTLALLQPEIHVYEDAGDWDKIAKGLPKERVDATSAALIAGKHPRDWGSEAAHPLEAAELTRRLAQFEARLTEESLMNEYSFHGAIHAQLARADRVDATKLNDFVYTRLFKTPRTDPWLGLTSATALTGLTDDGLVTRPVTLSAR